MLKTLRLLWGGFCAALGVLALLPAPTFVLWQVAVLVTEWGYALALPALLTLLPGWRRTRVGRVGAALGLGAALALLTPLLRALPVAQQLPARLQAAFGAAETTRTAPLKLGALVRGVAVPTVHYQRMVYAQPDNQQLVMDIYRPLTTRASSAPGVLIIHGGSWQSGDSTQLAPLNHYLAARGYLVAAISYRLAPQAPFPAARDDVLTAVAFLKGHAGEFGLDAGRLVLLGRSAGGQLALLAAYTANDPAIRGVVSFYGPTDLRYGYANPSNPWVIDSRGTLEAYLGGTPTSAGAAYDAAAPINFVAASTPPTLLIHGERDELVSFRHSERLAQRLEQAGVAHLLLRLPWATHGCDFAFNGPSGQLSNYAVEQFLGVVMRDT